VLLVGVGVGCWLLITRFWIKGSGAQGLLWLAKLNLDLQAPKSRLSARLFFSLHGFSGFRIQDVLSSKPETSAVWLCTGVGSPVAAALWDSTPCRFLDFSLE
jgi:hypothetical protein